MSDLLNVARRLQDLEKRVLNMLRPGVVASVNLTGTPPTVTVTFGDVTTGPIPWLTQRAGPDSKWWAPEVGEQVLILAPMGNLNIAYALPAIFQAAFPAPSSSANQDVTTWADGSSLTYDRAAHQWTLNVVGGNITLAAGGTVTLSGASIVLTGPVTASSTITAAGDVKAGSISLESHVHGGVQSGGSNTSGPH